MLARVRMALLGVSMLASMLLVACGGSDDESTSTPAGSTSASAAAATETSSGGGGDDFDVCALLTAADLDAATGLTWGEGVFNESLSSDQQFICDWVATSGGFATAQVLVHPTDQFFESNRGSAESIFGLADPPSITGAGDTYATADGDLVAMKIGGHFVQVAYIPPDAANVREATTQLAQAVAGRM